LGPTGLAADLAPHVADEVGSVWDGLLVLLEDRAERPLAPTLLVFLRRIAEQDADEPFGAVEAAPEVVLFPSTAIAEKRAEVVLTRADELPVPVRLRCPDALRVPRAEPNDLDLVALPRDHVAEREDRFPQPSLHFVELLTRGIARPADGLVPAAHPVDHEAQTTLRVVEIEVDEELALPVARLDGLLLEQSLALGPAADNPARELRVRRVRRQVADGAGRIGVAVDDPADLQADVGRVVEASLFPAGVVESLAELCEL